MGCGKQVKSDEAASVPVAAVYQEPAIYPHLSVLENIFAGDEITTRFGAMRRAAMAAVARPWFERLDLPSALLDRRMGRLSLAYQQLVLIAKALVLEARVIIFDEPTSILSQTETARLFAIINRLRADGRGIVYITHRLDEIGQIADRVTVLTDGRVTGEARRGEFDEARLVALMAGSAHRDYAAARARRRAGAGPPEFEVRQGQVFGVPFQLLCLYLPMLAAFIYAQHGTRFGRELYLAGSSTLAASLAGLRVRRLRGATYVVSGLVSGIAGIVDGAWLGTARPDARENANLISIAIVVLGGTGIFGGTGSVIGTALATVVIAIIDNGLSYSNVNPIYQAGVIGVILLATILADNLVASARARAATGGPPRRRSTA